MKRFSDAVSGWFQSRKLSARSSSATTPSAPTTSAATVLATKASATKVAVTNLLAAAAVLAIRGLAKAHAAIDTSAETPPPLPPYHITQTLQDVSSWLKDCTRRHAECKNEVTLRATLKELKVIDCITRTIVAAPRGCRYVALSYVWGADQTISSLDGNLLQTIEDSIQVVLALGHRYLWIDRYVCPPFLPLILLQTEHELVWQL